MGTERVPIRNRIRGIAPRSLESRGMKPRLVHAAADRLASPITGPQTALDAPLAEQDVLRVLARIARTGKPGDRLRAAELIGKQLGMFREEAQRGPTLEEIVLEAERLRRCRLSAAPSVEVTALPAPSTGEPQ
jgi:hypothetical protein